MSNTQQPTFTAYAVTRRGDGQDDWWTPVGSAFIHQDGEGYNVVLQAMPLNGKIVLRPPKDSKEQQAAREGNNRRRNERRER